MRYYKYNYESACSSAHPIIYLQLIRKSMGLHGGPVGAAGPAGECTLGVASVPGREGRAHHMQCVDISS